MDSGDEAAKKTTEEVERFARDITSKIEQALKQALPKLPETIASIFGIGGDGERSTYEKDTFLAGPDLMPVDLVTMLKSMVLDALDIKYKIVEDKDGQYKFLTDDANERKLSEAMESGEFDRQLEKLQQKVEKEGIDSVIPEARRVKKKTPQQAAERAKKESAARSKSASRGAEPRTKSASKGTGQVRS